MKEKLMVTKPIIELIYG
ncbi:Protein of unknown function [Bacillus cereus]|nr:Protein of unknown function [Bacillus cereus]